MDFRDNQAIYLQIATWVYEKILLKNWPPESRLPSVRELAVELQVNPNTVMRTYDYLQQQAVIRNQRGIGFFVETDAIPKILAYRKEQFLNQELPIFFKDIFLLNIDIEEIKQKYEDFKKINEPT